MQNKETSINYENESCNKNWYANIKVKYFSDDKLNNYDMADKLESLFARSLKVNDRVLNISNVEPNFLTDEVGDMLDFLIYITYFDFIKLNNETCDNMQDVNLNMKG